MLKTKLISLVLMLILITVSCEDQFEVLNEGATVSGTNDADQKSSKRGDEIGSHTISSTAAACGGSFNGNYSVINKFYIYPNRTIDVSCAPMGATITVSVSALDVPNRFTIRDVGNTYVAGTNWLGNASYPGSWGSSLNNSGTANFTFTKNANTYYLQVETQTPPNYNYSPNTDYWSATATGTGTVPCQ